MSKRKPKICTRNADAYVQSADTGTLCLSVESADEEDMYERETPRQVDIKRLCRMCAQPCTVATSTNLMEPNATLTYQLLHYFGIMMLPEDHMPTRICHMCTNELQHWEELKNDVQKAQSYLKMYCKQDHSAVAASDESDLEIYNSEEDSASPSPSKIKTVPRILQKPNLSPTKAKVPPSIEICEASTASEEVYECSYCSCTFTDGAKFKKHQSRHTGVISVDTKMSKQATRNGMKSRTIRTADSDNPYQCGLCPSKFNKGFLLAEHLQNHCSVNKYLKLIPCPYCKIVVRKIGILIEHVQKHIENPDQDVAHACHICDKQFIRLENLKMHMTLHQEAKKYRCSYCEVCYKYKSQLADHMERHRLEAVDSANNEINEKLNQQKPPTCGVCLQFFTSYADLCQHLKKDHNGQSEHIYYQCGNCKTSSKSLEVLINHITSKHDENQDVGGKFQCEICQKEFGDSSTFRVHYNNIHKKKSIHDCPFCKIIFTNVNLLKDHVARSHINTAKERRLRRISPKPVITKTCLPIAPKIKTKIESLVTYTEPMKILYIPDTHSNPTVLFNEEEMASNINLLSELEVEPEPNVVEINMDAEIAAKPDTVYESINCEVEDAYPCGLCHQKFSNSILFLEHCQVELNQLKHKMLPCGYCGCMFKKLHVLLKHTEDHILNPSKVLTHQCNICMRRFHMKNNYNSHMRTHEELKRFSCKICGNQYKHKNSWKAHFDYNHKDFQGDESEAVESLLRGDDTDDEEGDATKIAFAKKNQPTPEDTEEHYSCDICNCKYLSPRLLYGHFLDKHFDPNILKCQFCTDILPTPEDLILHLENHSKVKKHFCPVCDKGFKMRSTMVEHIDLHSMERKYQCDQCVKSYRARTSLSIHKRHEHSGTKETFMCEYCSKIFTTKAQLKRHIASHQGIVPFKCAVCGKGCSNSSRLQEHMYVHSDIKPLHCLKCSKGFISKKHWRNHMRKTCCVPEQDIPYIRPRFFNSVF